MTGPAGKPTGFIYVGMAGTFLSMRICHWSTCNLFVDLIWNALVNIANCTKFLHFDFDMLQFSYLKSCLRSNNFNLAKIMAKCSSWLILCVVTLGPCCSNHSHAPETTAMRRVCYRALNIQCCILLPNYRLLVAKRLYFLVSEQPY